MKRLEERKESVSSELRSLPTSGTLELERDSREPVPLRFIREDDVIYLAAAGDLPRWAKSVLAAGRAWYRIDQVRGSAEVRLVSDAASVERLTLQFRRSLGEDRWNRHFGRGATLIALVPTALSAGPSSDDSVRAEFDAVANGYTAAVQGNAVDRYLRERSRPRIIATMAERDPLLEIGCGTGLETLDVMRAGHHVTAVDISPNMLAELTARADRAGLRPFLTTVRGALNTIDSSLAAAPDSSFRGAYSTFGALNIEPDLVPLGRALGRVLASGSPFFAGVLSRTAIVPQLWQWAAGHPEEARARSRCPIPASGARFPLQLYPLGAAELQTALGDQFRLRRVEAASVLAPPTDYPKARRRTPPAMRRSAARVDSALARIPGVRGWGDWLFLTFERR